MDPMLVPQPFVCHWHLVFYLQDKDRHAPNVAKATSIIHYLKTHNALPLC